ncbi:MAG: iron transporter [Arsenophonus sp. ER-EMS1-MAG3]
MKLVYNTIILYFISFFSIKIFSKEYPLGKPIINEGMEIQGIYLQPITMSTDNGSHISHQVTSDKADIHLEADIHSAEENPNGFAEGDWIPYLIIEYSVIKLSIKPKIIQSGTFMPMIAIDGPHYGDNIKLDGYGKYRIIYKIYPPSYNKKIIFGRHIDKETGVAPWFKSFEVSWDFNYTGIGRKNNYY